MTARRPTLLIAGDPAGLDGIAGLGSVPRSNSWSASLGFSALHAWDLPGAVRRIARVDLALTRTSDGFTVSTPQAALQSALDASRRATPRLTAVAATAAAAIAAFLILAAGALRAGILAEDRRLAFRGASPAQRSAMVGVETAVPLVAGAVAGVALALIGGWLRARAGGAPSGRAESAVLSALAGRGLLVLAAAWLVTALAARLPAAAVRPALVLAGVAAAAALAGLLSGRSGAEQPLRGAVVPLAGALAALVTGLLLPVALRALSRTPLGRRRSAGPALVQLARDSGPAAVVVAGLAVGCGLGVFAVGYAATLRESRRDRAEHVVPVAAVVSAGRALEPPLHRLSLGGWRAATGAADAAPVLRIAASALAGPQRRPVAVLGVPAATLGGLDGERTEGARPRALAARLTAGPWARPAPGALLGARSRRLAVRLSRVGDDVRLTALIRDPSGTLQRLALGSAPARPRTLTVAIPRALQGGALLGLGLDRETGQLITATHQTAEGGGGGGSVTTGVLRLGRVAVDDRPLATSGWRGHGGVTGAPARLRYAISGAAQAMVRAPVASDRAPLPVLADPASAADAALSHGLELDVAGADFPAAIVGVVTQMPTVGRGSRLLVADRAALAGAIDAQQPGAAQPAELWLDSPPSRRAALAAAASAQARRLGLRVRTRAAVQSALNSEPIGREVLGALTATTLLVVLLGIAAAAVMVRSDLRDRAATLRDLEEQGHGPRELRRGLRTRAARWRRSPCRPGPCSAGGSIVLLSRARAAPVAAARHRTRRSRGGAGGSPASSLRSRCWPPRGRGRRRRDPGVSRGRAPGPSGGRPRERRLPRAVQGPPHAGG